MADKNSEIKYQNSTTAEQQGTKITSIGSEPYLGRVAAMLPAITLPLCEISTEVELTKSPQDAQQQLGRTISRSV